VLAYCRRPGRLAQQRQHACSQTLTASCGPAHPRAAQAAKAPAHAHLGQAAHAPAHARPVQTARCLAGRPDGRRYPMPVFMMVCPVATTDFIAPKYLCNRTYFSSITEASLSEQRGCLTGRRDHAVNRRTGPLAALVVIDWPTRR
jgi:hypothetical protein